MKDFGAYLKQERETRETSLDEVARVTRISRRFLVALEEGRTEDLPELTFVRGFLRAYAEAVGMDGSALVLRYEAEVLDSATRGRSRLDWRRWAVAGTAVLAAALFVAALLSRRPVEGAKQAPLGSEARPRVPAPSPTLPPPTAPPTVPTLDPAPAGPVSPAATSSSPVPVPSAPSKPSEAPDANNPLADLVGLAPDDETAPAVP